MQRAQHNTFVAAALGTMVVLGGCGESDPIDVELSETFADDEASPAFPDPELVLDGSYVRTTNGYEFVHYDLSVRNWAAYGPQLFELRPDLPPCGRNTNASRTWVEIYDGSGRRMYGFCALASPENLNDIWVAVQTSAEQPSGIYIELWDRAMDVRVRSNVVVVP